MNSQDKNIMMLCLYVTVFTLFYYAIYSENESTSFLLFMGRQSVHVIIMTPCQCYDTVNEVQGCDFQVLS